MMRALLGFLLSSMLRLALLAERLRPKPVLPPPPATLVPLAAERYVNELASLPLARADAVLGYALGNPGSMYYAGHFPKVADARWRH